MEKATFFNQIEATHQDDASLNGKIYGNLKQIFEMVGYNQIEILVNEDGVTKIVRLENMQAYNSILVNDVNIQVLPKNRKITIYNAIMKAFRRYNIIYVVVREIFDPSNGTKVEMFGCFNDYRDAVSRMKSVIKYDKRDRAYSHIWKHNDSQVEINKEYEYMVCNPEYMYHTTIKRQFLM